MQRFRVNVTFAPAGGRRVRHDETIEIEDSDAAGVYAPFIARGWLTPEGETPAEPVPTFDVGADADTEGHAWQPGDDELAVIDDGDPDRDLPADEHATPDESHAAPEATVPVDTMDSVSDLTQPEVTGGE